MENLFMEIDYNGRDRATGRLLPGARIGNGNPNAKRQHELKKALMACATETDIQDIYKSMLRAAKTGDVAAAKVLLDHLLGRPSQSVEISGPDGEPAKLNLSSLTAVILTALGPDHDARWRVAEALAKFSPNPQLEASASGRVDGDGIKD
jgi:hypothetical protein